MPLHFLPAATRMPSLALPCRVRRAAAGGPGQAAGQQGDGYLSSSSEEEEEEEEEDDTYVYLPPGSSMRDPVTLPNSLSDPLDRRVYYRDPSPTLRSTK